VYRTRPARLQLAPRVRLAYNRHVKDLLHRVRVRYRYPAIILRAMVDSDLKLRYQASFLGYLWTLLRPLAIFSILYVVFVRFLRLGAGIPYYAIYLLLGIVGWGFFSELTNQALSSIVVRAPLMRKVNFPRYVVVLSVGASVLISFVLNMLVIALFMIVKQVPVRLEVLWIIPLFVELAVLSVSVALFLSALYVRFRDLHYIWEVFMQAAFYATPILYPLILVPEMWARILVLNPMAQILQDARYVLVTDQAQTISQLWGSGWARAIPVGITMVLAVTSVIFFRRRSRTFAEEA
jgi:ABC-2 type transport system permease protein